MNNKQSSKPATNGVAVSPVRAQRLNAIAQALVSKRVADKQARHAAAMSAWEATQAEMAKQKEFEQAVAQLQQQYGITLKPVAPRANSATEKPSPTSIMVDGVSYLPTKAVHALFHKHKGNRKAVLEEAKDLGINPSTATTQYGVAKKEHGYKYAPQH